MFQLILIVIIQDDRCQQVCQNVLKLKSIKNWSSKSPFDRIY